MTAWCDMMCQIEIIIKKIWTCQNPLCCCSLKLFLPIWSNTFYLYAWVKIVEKSQMFRARINYIWIIFLELKYNSFLMQWKQKQTWKFHEEYFIKINIFSLIVYSRPLMLRKSRRNMFPTSHPNITHLFSS